jgi:phospholipid/cholesterol/gamma-HCH transport system substrate-binding protein
MPRTRSLAWSELKIGLLAILAVSLAVFLIFVVGGQGGFFWQRYPLKARFPNALGLKSGSIVRLSGVDVGSVSDVRFDGAEVEVTFEVNRSMRERITTESRATIGSLSLLGEATVDLTAAASGQVVPDGGTVVSLPPAPLITDITAKAASGLDEMSKLMADLRAGKGTLGKLVTDQSVYDELSSVLKTTESVVANLNKTNGTMGKLINDPAVYTELRGSLAELRAMTAKISAGEGSLGRLLKDDTLARSATEMAKNLEDVTGRLRRGEGTAGKLISDDGLYQRIDSLTGRMDTLISSLNDGQGTAGQLLNDRQLYDNLNGAVGDMRQLLAEIRGNPKKYLNVKVSIF